MRILNITHVIDLTGLSQRTVYDEMTAGRFPRPVQLTARRVGWPEEEVEAWIASRIAARDSGKVPA